MTPFVITGIPRSGTTVLSDDICKYAPNAWCFNEDIYDYWHIAERLQRGAGNFEWAGSKVTTPYLDFIQIVLSQVGHVFACIRDPAYTIASLLQPECSGINITQVSDIDMTKIWTRLPIVSDAKIERMAEIWNHYAQIIFKFYSAGKMEVATYESRSEKGWWRSLSEPFGEMFRHIPLLENRNDEERYDCDFGEIRDAVRKYCTYAPKFGYEI